MGILYGLLLISKGLALSAQPGCFYRQAGFIFGIGLDMAERAIIYLRKSRGDREDLAKHRAILLRLAAAAGHTPEVREEIGSGETISGRPVFSKLLTELAGKSSEPVTLYVMDADRLTRGDPEERGHVYAVLMRAGVTLRTPAGTVSLANVDERLLTEIRGALAGWELGKYKARAAAARAELLRQSKPRNGSCPFGYRYSRERQQIEADPETFPILKDIIRDAWRLSTRQLALKYQRSPRRVWCILTSPTICGYACRRSDGKSWLPRSDWEWAEAPGGWEAAISRPEWHRLMAVLSDRMKERAKPGDRDGWCRGLLEFPGLPEGRVVLSSVRYGGKVDAPTYSLRVRGPDGRPKQVAYVLREPAHAAATAAIRQALLSEAWWASIAADALSRRESASRREMDKDPRIELEELRSRLDALGEALDRETDEEDRASLLRRREALKQAIRKAQAQLKAEQQQGQVDGQRLLALKEIAGKFAIFWAECGAWEKEQVAGAVLETIEVTVTPGEKGQPYTREIVAKARLANN